MKIERPGIYAVDLGIDNRQLMSPPLYEKAPPEGFVESEGELQTSKRLRLKGLRLPAAAAAAAPSAAGDSAAA